MDVTGHSALVFPLPLATMLPLTRVFTYLAFPWAEDRRVAHTGTNFSTSINKVSAQEKLRIGSFRPNFMRLSSFPSSAKCTK